ncbi:MAG: hypothetical protein CTY12_08115 [Methylotenera sp.]|nr:MAG: hypothetical protein CTY12_08115 [Methylotenera sp.]
MTIKNIIYSAHHRLEQVANLPIKRSHVYELIAAAFGFNTYASLTNQAFLIQSKKSRPLEAKHMDLLQQRSEALGYRSILTEALTEVMKEHRISALSFSDLVAQLKNEDYLNEYDWESDDSTQLISPEVFHALEAAAKSGNPLAHYAIALHHANSDESDEDGISSDYWYKQMQSGRELNGAEKEFALAYLQQLTSQKKYQFHLREAGRLGSELALLDLAEKFDDHAFFETGHRDVNTDPMRVADIARELNRSDDYRYWLTVAADAGNIDAMQELIKIHEKDDPIRCWTWIYLSKLLGKDLTQDRYYAIHEDGSMYDDDIGGPLFADGEEGINLPSLESEHDSLARANAEALLKLIKTT